MTPPGSATHRREENHNPRSPPQGAKDPAHIRLLSPGVLHWGNEPPEHLALKTCKTYIWKGLRATGNRHSTLTGACAKRHILQVPGERQQFEKRLGQTHMLILDSLPERQEATGLPLGTQMLAEPFLRACFTTITLALAHTTLESSLSPTAPGVYLPIRGPGEALGAHGAHRQQFRDPAPPASRSPILLRHQPITQKAASLFRGTTVTSAGRALPSSARGQPSPQGQPRSGPTRAEGRKQPTQGNTRVCRSGDQRGVWAWAPQEAYYPRPLLQDQEVRLSYLTQGIRDLRSQRNMSQQRNNI